MSHFYHLIFFTILGFACSKTVYFTPARSQEDISDPSQEDIDSFIIRTEDGPKLNVLDLLNVASLESVPPTELAQLLSTSKGFQLSGVKTTEEQWKTIAESSRRNDWAPKEITLKNLDQMTGIWSAVGNLALMEVVAATKKVELTGMDLDRWALSENYVPNIIEQKCKNLEVWYTGEDIRPNGRNAKDNIVFWANLVMQGVPKVVKNQKWEGEQEGGVIRLEVAQTTEVDFTQTTEVDFTQTTEVDFTQTTEVDFTQTTEVDFTQTTEVNT